MCDEQPTVSRDIEVSDSLSERSVETIAAPAIPPSLPQRIGRYRLIGVIGYGGMGAVYKAVQDSPRRIVAVKVMKQGISSRSALRRFEYESQLLGRLHHPGIAQVYEAGMHDDGTGGVPYFAMEYIADATTFTQYANAKKLRTRERLELFAKVCDAVHHGHQKGIIHRDLKPENILVDSSGEPKIIDFGVARATDSDLAVTTMRTEVGQLVGTVPYMSPEQIEADPHDIDTRSDVYGLGVVLHKLLTGELPYDLSGTPVYEATRIIREQPPIRISTFDRTLRGDIETIVLHALEKQRDRRYQSAAELAQDICRYLNHQPISARPPSLVYLMTTFTKRNKVLVTGIAAVFVALGLGIIGTSVGLVQARMEANTYTAVSGFFEQAFGSLEARDGAGPKALVADLLDDAADKIDSELGDQPRVQARLRWSIGNGYRALTLYDKAEEQLRAALTTQRRVLGEPHQDVAQALEDLAAVLWFRERFDEAEPMFRESLHMRRRLFGDEHEEVASSLNYLAACVNSQRRHSEAEELYRQSLGMRRRIWGERHEMVARTKNNLATCLMYQRRYDEAEQLLRDAVDIVRTARGLEHIDVAGGLSNLARCLVSMDRLEEAERLFREALDIKRKRLREGHASVALTRRHLADLLNNMGQYDEAEQLCRAALKVQRQRFEPPHPRIISSTSLLANILCNQGDLAGADQVLRDLIELRRLEHPAGHWQVAAAESRLGACIARQGHYREAEPLLVESYRHINTELGADHQETLVALDRLVVLYEAWDKLDQAQQYRELLVPMKNN